MAYVARKAGICMKKVLVYPCGTEIGLEIYRALRYSPKYEIYGGSSGHDHGEYVYTRGIEKLPFINDDSTEEDVAEFEQKISSYGFDFIYPAMDAVLTVFAKYRHCLSPVVVAPPFETADITRSKRKTYAKLQGLLPIPQEYKQIYEIKNYPVFMKPDKGQGAVGAEKVSDKEELQRLWNTVGDGYLILEYLPGKEYTVDCFTNEKGKLIYARGRERKRIKNGISVNTCFSERPEFWQYAYVINQNLAQKGAWFFQLKETATGELKLLEVASRIAGTSALSRCSGVNLPLLTLNQFNGIETEDVVINDYQIELDRALENSFRTGISYTVVYVDYDDTLLRGKDLNIQLVRFLYQCVNQRKRLVLLSKHMGDLQKELSEHRIKELFDEIIQLSKDEDKSAFIKEKDAIFIDDSYGERKRVAKKCGISVFDVHMIDGLIQEDTAK